MANLREVRQRTRSVKNIAQVTRALQAVSASKVRKAMQAMMNTRPYATSAWNVLCHIAGQPGRASLHPLLTTRPENRRSLVVLISGDRGLAGAYNSTIIRFAMAHFADSPAPVGYVAVGRKGRDILMRRRREVVAEFSNLPAAPAFIDISAIGRLSVDEFLSGRADRVYLVYTDFVSMSRQIPRVKQLLPLEVSSGEGRVDDFSRAANGSALDQTRTQNTAAGNSTSAPAAYIYEPGEEEILDQIVPRFTALQVYQAILVSLASEHASRMLAMKNATDSATDLAGALQLEYNKARQQNITNEMLDIAGGAEAQGGLR